MKNCTKKEMAGGKRVFTIFGIFFIFFTSIVAFFMFFVSAPRQPLPSVQADQTETSADGSSALSPVSLIDRFSQVQCLDDSTKTEIMNILEGTGDLPTSRTCLGVLVDSCFKKQQEQFPALTENFQNGAETSQLYAPALDLLMQLDAESKTVVDAMSLVWPQGRSLDEGTNPISQCRVVQSELYDSLKSALKNLALESANAKKTYKIVSKYKEINAHLSELTDQMGKFNGYMDRVAQRIPAFSKYCQ